jgi:site-specific recombinase XerD
MSEDLQPMTPEEGIEKYLAHRKIEVSEETLQTYDYRLRKFNRWTDEVGLDNLNDLTGRKLDEYERHRRQQGIKKTTLKGDMKDFRMAVRYWERIEAVADGLADKVPVVNPKKHEEVSQETLDEESAMPLLRYYRHRTPGTRNHAFLELAWSTAARVSGLQALDMRDFYPEEGYVWFRHRPGQGTSLKKNYASERVVSIPDRVVEALRGYISDKRYAVRDDHGRHPLFTSQQGRPHKNTIRGWSYHMTQPCRYGDCPHGYDPAECDFREHGYYSKCPSSKSTHPIRKGSISWHLGNGVPMELVEARCDASREVIELHYDMRSPEERMQHRRGTVLPKLKYA